MVLVVCYFSGVNSTGLENGFLSFSVSKLTVVEDSIAAFTTLNIPFTREGGTDGSVVVTFEVSTLFSY